MPTYSFRDKNTGKVFDQIMRIAEREQFLQDNPRLESVITGAPTMGDSVRLGIRGTDSGFKEVLSKISAANYKSNLKDKLSRS
jgi:predicted nucleic acid-binding Zn ribbon protein